MVKRTLTLLAVILALLPGSTTYAVGPGDEGLRVAEVQQLLSGFGYTVQVDGHYGPQTEKAVRSWQKSNGLQVDGIAGPITLESLRSARRLNNATRQAPSTQPDEPGGLDGKPFAPPGLDLCDEMMYYAQQFGLPPAFRDLGYRESRCRNEDAVRTFCCYGYWQNYISSHLSRYSAYRSRIINECKVTGADDINSNTPIDKQRQACVTGVVYSISGFSPWR